MKNLLLILTTILVSVWLCAGSQLNLLRHRRSISESTRSHNEYDTSDHRGHRTKSNIDASLANCLPGTTWKNDCNTCWCSENGVAACTYMACLHLDNNNNELTNNQHRQSHFGHKDTRKYIPHDDSDNHNRIRRSDTNSPDCIPGTTWKQDCNSCWCTETGIAACTLMGCLHLPPFNNNNAKGFDPIIRIRRKRSSSGTTTNRTRFQNSLPENERNCKHGTTWMKSCNRCRCFGGRAACTRMMCLEKEDNL